MSNLILKTDSYKVTHWKQYPQGTTRVASFLESRGGKFPATVFFGLQYLIKKHLLGNVVAGKDILEAENFFAAHFGNPALFNLEGWEHIFWEHGGRLPVRIKAVPEGTVVPTGNVLMTVENTDNAVPWLTNYLETLLCQVWYPTTVATQSYQMKKEILWYLNKTGDPTGVDFKLHDFGYRGSTSDESAGIGGAAHLVNFKGTDTMAGLVVARDYYGEEMAGFSIPAAEHSTITSWGKEHEVDACRNMLDQYPSGLVAVVSDSYDIFNAAENIWGKELKDRVLARDGVLVVRPDSGDPHVTLLKVLKLLGNAYGTTINDKGYKVLNPKVRVIQGDGIDYESFKTIMATLKVNNWSIDNIAFGSGGGLLQKVDRDTCKFAFKCSAVKVGDEWRPVMKDPVTDPGKRSKAGRLKLIHDFERVGEGYKTVTEDVPGTDLLVPVFENGELLVDQTFSDIRARASLS